MTLLVLDSGGVSRLSLSSQNATSAVSLLKREGIWPPVVPSIVLVESLSGRQRTDANVNRFLKTCVVVENLPERLARRAGTLRAQAGRGSAVDAAVVALAEPGGTVLTNDLKDMRALAAHALEVQVQSA